MYKILIFWNKYDIKHVGGPSGYLVPFLNSKFNNFELFFLENKSDSYKIKNGLTIFDFDVIIFHLTSDIYNMRYELEKYPGIVILQSHSPKPPFLELIQDFALTFQNKIKRRLLRYKFEEIDKFAFLKADYIIFPCKEAEEPYYNTWSFFRNHYSSIHEKTRYIITGIKPCNNYKTNIDIRKKYNLSKDAKIFVFLGRPQKVKGFDTFIRLAKCFKDKKDTIFIHFGQKASKYPAYKNYIEAGYQDNIMELLSQCNYVLNLNKQTYFDLGVIESLYMGCNIILSYTGGNKKICELFGSLVTSYSSFKELKNKITKIKISNHTNKDEIITLAHHYFNETDFLKNFESTITNLLRDNN